VQKFLDSSRIVVPAAVEGSILHSKALVSAQHKYNALLGAELVVVKIVLHSTTEIEYYVRCCTDSCALLKLYCTVQQKYSTVLGAALIVVPC
jgi:hypothetical protein